MAEAPKTPRFAVPSIPLSGSAARSAPAAGRPESRGSFPSGKARDSPLSATCRRPRSPTSAARSWCAPKRQGLTLREPDCSNTCKTYAELPLPSTYSAATCLRIADRRAPWRRAPSFAPRQVHVDVNTATSAICGEPKARGRARRTEEPQPGTPTGNTMRRGVPVQRVWARVETRVRKVRNGEESRVFAMRSAAPSRPRATLVFVAAVALSRDMAAT